MEVGRGVCDVMLVVHGTAVCSDGNYHQVHMPVMPSGIRASDAIRRGPVMPSGIRASDATRRGPVMPSGICASDAIRGGPVIPSGIRASDAIRYTYQ